MATTATPQQQKARRTFAIAEALRHWLAGLREDKLAEQTLRGVSNRFPRLTQQQQVGLARYGVTFVVAQKTPGGDTDSSVGAWFDSIVGGTIDKGLNAAQELTVGWVKELLGFVGPRAGLVLLYPALTALAGILIVFGLSRALGTTPGGIASSARARLETAGATDEIPF